jgi:hypothetical protein
MSTEYAKSEPSAWTGWVIFAGIMMIIAGGLWALQGVVALFNDEWVVFGPEAAIVLDITGWGWVHIILGVALVLAGFLVMAGNMVGRVIAVILASLSIFVNFLWLPVYPIWAIVVITIDVLVLYAVIVHGKELKSS